MLKYEKKVLKNGLRVILAPMENTEAMTLLVLVGVGSRNEAKKINGISHFLEHLFFKGTKSRPKPGQINKDLDKIGASHNAFTSHEYTGFWVKSSVKDFDMGLDIVSDILLESLFNKEEIDKERGVILQEINMYEDIPQKKVIYVLLETIHDDQPLGKSILGTPETINKIRRSDILKYQKENYSAQNMVLVVAGGINKKEVYEKVNKAFGKTKKTKSRKEEKVKNTQKTARIKFINKKTDQAHLIIGLRAYDTFDERKYALELLSIILGGNISSRLFMEIREKRGLAYYVGSEVEEQKDWGFLGVRMGVANDSLEKAVKKTVEIFSSLKTKGVSKQELKDAKSYVAGQTALSFETSDQIADFYGGQELFHKKILQPEEILKKIEKVSQSDILKVAKDIFRYDKINMAVIGRNEDSKKNQDLFKKIFKKI